jgi:hypothetical protein
MNETPDPTADLNYFFPYLELERFSDFHDTPTAAYFSHYEEDNEHKTDLWQRFAPAVDLRIVTAQLYGEQVKQFGPTVLARPAVDSQFVPASAKQNSRTVGVSGVISKRSKRKGEDLVFCLAKERGDLQVKASGAGWREISTTFYDWIDMHTFYQSLDVFLCTSTIEGVPMTTLEALACGVPVVIPLGVGLHDELPIMEGIYHYEAGNYAAMTQALDLALRHGGGAGDLRQAVQSYNAHNWYMDHERAFENLLYSVPLASPAPKWSAANAGLYVVAYGDNARECARVAIASFREHMGLPAALVSDAPLGPETVFIERSDTDIGARGAKLSVEELAPAEWDYVLYLDADTETVAPVNLLFDALQDGWEFVICKNPVRYHVTFNMVRPDYVKECQETFEFIGTDEAIQLNGGVWAYRRTPQARKLMQAWYNEWNRYGARDQAALLRALKQYPVRTYVLGNEWNYVDRYERFYKNPCAGIMHYPMTARRWSGRIYGRLDSAEAWEKVEK